MRQITTLFSAFLRDQNTSMFTKILANWGTGAIPPFNFWTPLPLNPLLIQPKTPQTYYLFWTMTTFHYHIGRKGIVCEMQKWWS